MQKLFTSLVLLLILNVSSAQKFDKVRNNVLINQFEAAKADFDKVLSKNPTVANTPEAIFWEAKIYNGFFKDSNLSKKYPNSFVDMKNNLEKLLSSEQGNAFINERATKDKEVNSPDPFIQVYTKTMTEGIKLYGQNKFKEAAELFNTGVKYSDVFYGRGWLDTKLKSDSIAILYTAICFEKEKNFAEALPRLERIINEHVMVSLETIYNDLFNCLIETKDKEKFAKYAAQAKKELPAFVETWEQFERSFLSKAYTLEEKVALYDKLVAEKKLNETDAETFGELLMEAKSEDANNEKYILKASEAFQQAFTMNPANYRAAYNSGISYFAQYQLLNTKLDLTRKSLQALNTDIEAKAPKDPAKKTKFIAGFKPQVDSIKAVANDITGKINAKSDQSITWLEKAFLSLKDKGSLSKQEKNIAFKSLQFIMELCQDRMEKLKSKDPKAAAVFEDKFKAYDKIIDTYK